ncbi:hypothetical protein G6F22_016624 [Rhizopus arrhizus]|nr:hypothetical protein G6F22_016624 [Rhizopus arrhizus]
MMNAGPLEHFDTGDIHNEGTQASIRRVTDALDAERIAVRVALGYAAPHFPLADHYAREGDEWMYGRGAHGKLTDSGDWRETIDLNTHRYMLEDTRLGLSFLVSAGRWAGVPTPVAQGLLSVASAITGRDLYAEGRTLEGLGLDALICVIGAGRMGEGITLSYLLAGRDVTLIDIKPRQPTEQSAHDARVLANLRRELATFSQLGLLDARQADAVMGRVRLPCRSGWMPSAMPSSG